LAARGLDVRGELPLKRSSLETIQILLIFLENPFLNVLSTLVHIFPGIKNAVRGPFHRTDDVFLYPSV
jgi:hypothetical protein